MLTVPDITLTEPVLLNAPPIVVVPVPADFSNVPELLKVNVPLDGVNELFAWASKVPLLFQVVVPVVVIVPPPHVVVPEASIVRSVSVSVPFVMEMPPLATVWPVPDWVPPLKLKRPATVTLAVPESVPAGWVRLPEISSAPFTVTVAVLPLVKKASFEMELSSEGGVALIVRLPLVMLSFAALVKP